MVLMNDPPLSLALAKPDGEAHERRGHFRLASDQEDGVRKRNIRARCHGELAQLELTPAPDVAEERRPGLAVRVDAAYLRGRRDVEVDELLRVASEHAR